MFYLWFTNNNFLNKLINKESICTMAQKILIVDDEAHIRMLIEQTLEELEDEGVEFLTAENGEIALEIIRDEEPDLVFLDVMMPKMNGMEVCKKVKKELGLNEIFIILLTAKGQELDRLKGQEVGADIYMTKPFDPEVILNKAKQVLGIV
jgi:DNA-binding response OmpR family regulator